jgi:Zn-dependent M28 family amino/carboxypeptidase
MENRSCKIQGWITLQAAEKLFRQCGMDYQEQKQMATKPNFRPIEMNARYSITLSNTWRKSVSRNVAGYFEGKTFPSEVLVYTAHWDHLGVGIPVDGDSIYNGASDNAAAMAWMLSIAEAFKASGEATDRSVLFLSPTAEEAGMLGSEYFVANSPFLTRNMVACFNNDVILMIGKFKDVTITGMGHSTLDSLLTNEAKMQGRYICNDPNPENGMFFRSDQLPFLKAGVPSLFAKGYSHQLELGREKTQDIIADYWKSTYHKPSDQFNPEIHNLEGLADDAKLFYSLGFSLANSQEWPKWRKDSEFFVER